MARRLGLAVVAALIVAGTGLSLNATASAKNRPGRLGIPAGHLPPPGECRIWYPGVPPGQQPPPGPCDELAHLRPPGTWLIRHPADHPKQVFVSVYDRRRPSLVVEIRVYDFASGAFIRFEK